MKKIIQGDRTYTEIDICTAYCPFCNELIQIGIDNDYTMICEHYKSMNKDFEFVFEKKD